MSDKKELKSIDKSKFAFVNNDRVLTDVKLDTKPVGYLKDAWNRFKKNKASVAATVIIAIIALFAIIAPWCTPYEINQADGYYKQVRPKVSAKASGFWDGCYTDDINDVAYIALQAIALGALDQDGQGNMTWDQATDYALNPIRKINSVNETTRMVGGVETTSTFRNVRVDSYYRVGFVNITGLNYEQYSALLKWQEETGKQVIYPFVDNSDPEVFPASNRGDANEANYWYAMTGNLTPLYPNDPEDLKLGYHEMTLEEVKEKGLWSLYASDYPRAANGDVIWFDALGNDILMSESQGVRTFYDADGNVIARYNINTEKYFDADGNEFTQFNASSVFFRDEETRAIAGGISSVTMYRGKAGVDMLFTTLANGDKVYEDEDGNVYVRYVAETGSYVDGDGNAITLLSHGTSTLFVNDADELVGAIVETKWVRDALGNELFAVADGRNTTYYVLDEDGNRVVKYRTEVTDTSKVYKNAAGEVLTRTNTSALAGTVYLRDADNKFYNVLLPFVKSYKDIQGNPLTATRNGSVITYSRADGTVVCRYDSAAKTYADGEGNVLTAATGDVVLLGTTDDYSSFVGAIFTDSYYTNEAGVELFRTDAGGYTYYKDANGNLIYRNNKDFYFDPDGNVLQVNGSRTNPTWLDANGAVADVAYVSSIAYFDAQGNRLTASKVYRSVSDGHEMTEAEVAALSVGTKYYTDVRYTNDANELVYFYDNRLETYFDGAGNALTKAGAGSVFFMDSDRSLLAGFQSPPKSELMMVKISTSYNEETDEVYRNYAVRVLYYNYYQYLNGHEPVYVLGADSQGYDILVRLAYGCRLSLLLAVAVSLINLIAGAIFGAIEGYYGGVVDMVMERITDILSGIPFIILVSLFKLNLVDQGKVSVVGGLLFAFVVTGWIGTAYATRMQFYRFKGQEYILAARTLGANDARLMFKHIFPNALGTLITSSVLVIPGVIFSETSLAYLGIVNFNGANTTSLGTMLYNGQTAGINKFPHIIFFPALILSLLMISFNLFGNGLRDAFNPSLRGTED
ncbi:MAG: ABC transporter permease [Clostridia bacterium]|nr:ABC transporter permease [Clostridia bacterium]